MKIDTKFDINNLVCHKFNTQTDKAFRALEVMEVVTQTCYGGTQVFYKTRQIVGDKHLVKWSVGHAVNANNLLGWNQYREDELIPAPQNIIDIILNADAEKG